jgi:hypothetical protein
VKASSGIGVKIKNGMGVKQSCGIYSANIRIVSPEDSLIAING